MPIYQIRLKEQLGQHWSSWFDGLAITNEANGETVLTVYPLEDWPCERKSKEQNSPQESC